MAKLKLDEHGLPVKSKVWVRFDDPRVVIVRNDGAKPDKEVRIYSLTLSDKEFFPHPGTLTKKKFGTTPGGRSYEITQWAHPQRGISRRVEVWGWGESHIKGRVKNLKNESAKVKRKYMDSFTRGVLDLGPVIQKSFTSHQNR